jgi:hypothetical protein
MRRFSLLSTQLGGAGAPPFRRQEETGREILAALAREQLLL